MQLQLDLGEERGGEAGERMQDRQAQPERERSIQAGWEEALGEAEVMVGKPWISDGDIEPGRWLTEGNSTAA